MTTRRWLQVLGAAVSLAAFASTAGPVHAHPMGNFSINHFSRLTVSAHAVRLLYIIDMAEIPTFQELNDLHGSADTHLPSAMRASYLQRKSRELARGLALAYNDRPLPLRIAASDLLFPPGAGGLPTERVYIAFEANLPRTQGTLTYADNNFAGRAGWKEIVAGTDGTVSARADVTSVSRSDSLTVYPASITSAPPQELSAGITLQGIRASQPAPPLLPARALIRQAEAPLLNLGGGWSSLARGLTRAGSKGASDGTSFNQSRNDPLSSIIAHKEMSLPFLLLALLVAFWFGAGHALSPGHGKTVVAAYLVGSRGTARHALILGLTVTATHTAGVFALGLVTLYLSRYIVPDQLYPWLGFLSGMLVALMGITLCLRRLRALRKSRTAADTTSMEHRHEHVPAERLARHGVQAQVNAGTFGGIVPVHAHSHTHGTHVHSLAGAAHVHGQSHSHGTFHGLHAHLGGHRHTPHDHDHSYERHHHGHSHDGALVPHRHGLFGKHHVHAPLPGQNGEKVRLRSLLALGVSGGLLPCPSALVVLLAAIAFHRVAFGMLLIVAFSLGLATVLTGIGILMVYGGRFMARVHARRDLPQAQLIGRAVRVLPVLSAGIVAGLGTVIALGALNPGILPAL